MGFEPSHGDRIGLAVQRLNHSATLSVQLSKLLIIIAFLFLISVDSDRPLDAHFW